MAKRTRLQRFVTQLEQFYGELSLGSNDNKSHEIFASNCTIYDTGSFLGRVFSVVFDARSNLPKVLYISSQYKTRCGTIRAKSNTRYFTHRVITIKSTSASLALLVLEQKPQSDSDLIEQTVIQITVDNRTLEEKFSRQNPQTTSFFFF